MGVNENIWGINKNADLYYHTEVVKSVEIIFGRCLKDVSYAHQALMYLMKEREKNKLYCEIIL